VQKLAQRFLPIADEVGRLQRGTDPECMLFRTMAEQGHYRGRTQPSSTRQGIYALAPSGAFLASCNTHDPRRVAKMLQDAWQRWEAMPEEARYDAAVLAEVQSVQRVEDRYPDDGLVLCVTSRDLPRAPGAKEPTGWIRHAWNRDHAWFTRAEVRSLIPASTELHARHAWPEALVLRIARCHLVDNVRGQTPAHAREDVRRAQLTAVVTAASGTIVELDLEGAIEIEKRGRWAVRGFADREGPGEQSLGLNLRLAGRMRFDASTERVTSFELAAAGERWGGTQFNNRAGDLDPNPIGFWFELAPSDARTPPASIWVYEQPAFRQN
jgi:hypothetical protein